MKLTQIVDFLNQTLQLSNFGSDASNNGLQVEGCSEVKKIVYAVDASLAVFEQAAALDADMIIVHHGLSWGSEPRRFVGATAKRLNSLFKRDISLYAAHLPLDAHPELGHNAQLAKFMELENLSDFCPYHGMSIGFQGRLSNALTLDELVGKINNKLISPPQVSFYGANIEKKV